VKIREERGRGFVGGEREEDREKEGQKREKRETGDKKVESKIPRNE